MIDQAPAADTRTYSPGLEGVLAAETALALVDGERGRLLYRGYRIGDLVERASYAAVANLLWTGEWEPGHHIPTAPVSDAVLTALRALPSTAKPGDSGAKQPTKTVLGTGNTSNAAAEILRKYQRRPRG